MMQAYDASQIRKIPKLLQNLEPGVFGSHASPWLIDFGGSAAASFWSCWLLLCNRFTAASEAVGALGDGSPPSFTDWPSTLRPQLVHSVVFGQSGYSQE